MNYNSAWYYIEIYGNWIDHLRNPIAKLVFDKKYRQDYVPGYYPAKSFGELNRQIGSIPDNPIQSLTDFNITIDSVYSSRDGSFSTVNLFYYLETVNEDFDIVGSNAVLFLTDGNEVDRLFGCIEAEWDFIVKIFNTVKKSGAGLHVS